jgi:hypothetical protein
MGNLQLGSARLNKASMSVLIPCGRIAENYTVPLPPLLLLLRSVTFDCFRCADIEYAQGDLNFASWS